MGIFDFLRRVDKHDPLANVPSIRAWLPQLPSNDPVGATEAIRQLLDTPGAGEVAPTVQRMRALLELDRESGPLQATLQGQYRLPTLSDEVHQRLWRASDGVARAFFGAYERACAAATEAGGGAVPAPELHGAFARLFHYAGVQARHGMFRYEHWIPGRWRQLHQHYGEACRRAMVAEAFVLDADAPLAQPLSPEQEYLQILLLQRLNTGNLNAQQIERAADWLRECAPRLQLAFQQPDGDGFWLDLGSGEGLQSTRPDQPAGELLYLDVAPLQARLAECAAEQAAIAAAGGPGAQQAGELRDLAQRLAALWTPAAPQQARRGERRADMRGAAVAFGWREIATALAAANAERKSTADQDPAQGRYAAYPQLRTAYERKSAAAKAATSAHTLWEVQDASESGLRLRSPTGDRTAYRLGALLALRLESDSRWQLGIVRRLRKLTADQTELGIEIIARDAALVAPKVLGSEERGSGYSVDGIEVSFGGTSFNAFYLPGQVRSSGRNRPSLLLPPSEFTIGRSLSVSLDGQQYEIVLAPPLERSRDWVWTPLELHAQAA